MTGAPLYLVSACSTPEQFVAAFRRYIDRIGLFVPIAVPLAAGKRGRMAITLVDGGVMLEGDCEVVSSSTRASALYGRVGMTIRFTAPDEPTKQLLEELDKARIALKPAAPTIGPRPADVPPEPRPTPPAPSGRIDANNALAECVVVGDTSRLRGGRSEILGVPVVQLPSEPPKAGQKFVIPNIAGKPTGGIPPIGAPRPKTPSQVPPVPPIGERPKTPSQVPAIPPRPKTPSQTPPIGAPPVALPSRPPPTADDTQRAMPPPPQIAAPAPKPAPPPPPPLADNDPSPAKAVEPIAPRPKPTTATQPSAVVPPPMARKPRVDPNPTIRDPKPLFSSEGDERTDVASTPAVPRTSTKPGVTNDGSSPRVGARKLTPIRGSAPLTTQPGVGAPAKRPPTSDPVGFPPAAGTKEATERKSRELASMRNALDDLIIEAGADGAPPAESPADDDSALVVSSPPVDLPSDLSLAPPGAPKPRAPLLPERVPRITEPPAVPEESRDTALMQAAEPDDSAANGSPSLVDPLGPTLLPAPSPFGMPSTAQLADTDGDWTMAPDGAAPVPLDKPEENSDAPDGDWTIAPAADVEGGWTEPEAPKVRVADPEAGGPPISSVASEVPAGKARPSPVKYEEDVPKVQVDPTLIEPLPDVTAGKPASASGSYPPVPRPGSGAWPATEAPPPPGPIPTPFPGALVLGPPGNGGVVPTPYPVPQGNGGVIPTPFPGALVAPNPEPLGAPLVPGAQLFGGPPQPMFPPGAAMPPRPPSGNWPATPASTMPGVAAPPGLPGMPYAHSAMPPHDGLNMPANTLPGMGGQPPSGAWPATDAPFPPSTYAVPNPHIPTPLPGAMTVETASRPSGPIDAEAQMRLMGMPHQRMLTDAGTGFFRDSAAHMSYETAENYSTGDATTMLEVGRKRRIIIIVVSAVLAVAIGIGVVAVVGGGSSNSTPTKPEPPPPPKQAVVPDAAIVQATPDAAEVAAPPDAPPQQCFVNVSSSPAGVDVSIDDAAPIAKTPAKIEIPCGTKVTLNFTKAPLIAQTRTITGTDKEQTVAKVTLGKTQFTVKVSSTPAGAAITVNGKAMGATPTAIKLPGFEAATIILSKDGYDSDTEKVTPKTNNATVHATLKKKKR